MHNIRSLFLQGSLLAFIAGAALGGLFLSVPSVKAQQSVQVPATEASVGVAISTATTTSLVAPITGQRIYVTAYEIVAAGTGNIQFISGTGATCGTGTVNLTGAMTLVAQSRIASGAGNGAVLALALSHRLCAVTSAAVGMNGYVAYAQY